MDSSNTPAEIVGIGAATLDCLTRGEIPKPGEVCPAKEIVFAGGGPVATALVAASRLGASTQLIDTLADDAAGEMIARSLTDHGVRIPERRTAGRSALASIQVCPQTAERSISYHPSDAPALILSDHEKNAIAAAKILHLNGRHLEAATMAATIASRANTLVSFDGGAGRFREAVAPLAFSADILIVAREFAESACGETASPPDLIESLATRCAADLIAITDGTNGSWIFRRGRAVFHQSAFYINSIVDTTGCGDCYHGTLLASLIRAKPDSECAREASAAAALVATALGGREALPDRPTLTAFLTRGDAASD